MSMLSLVFTVCLAADPGTCEQREIPVFEPISAMACTMAAPATIARWRATHPDWRVSRWTCIDPRRQEGTARR
ncbi:MAG: hypothetical protein AAFV49_04775 [Pseudomonadota bacterium]